MEGEDPHRKGPAGLSQNLHRKGRMPSRKSSAQENEKTATEKPALLLLLYLRSTSVFF